jgi:hypothetical protein
VAAVSKREGAGVRLTTTQVSLIAAGIALAAPLVTYRASARLDRDRWVRERRAETYIDVLATLGRVAVFVVHPERSSGLPPEEHWRLFQARVEAFGSRAVIDLRDKFLHASDSYRAVQGAADELGPAKDPAAQQKRKEVEERAEVLRGEVGDLYARLERQVRQELQQEWRPAWRRSGAPDHARARVRD